MKNIKKFGLCSLVSILIMFLSASFMGGFQPRNLIGAPFVTPVKKYKEYIVIFKKMPLRFLSHKELGTKLIHKLNTQIKMSAGSLGRQKVEAGNRVTYIWKWSSFSGVSALLSEKGLRILESKPEVAKILSDNNFTYAQIRRGDSVSGTGDEN